MERWNTTIACHGVVLQTFIGRTANRVIGTSVYGRRRGEKPPPPQRKRGCFTDDNGPAKNGERITIINTRVRKSCLPT